MRSVDYLRRLMADDDSTRVNEAGNDTARSKQAERVSPDPEAYTDPFGPRSDFLRRMDRRSRQTKVLSHGPTAEATRAAAIVDAANAARGRGKP